MKQSNEKEMRKLEKVEPSGHKGKILICGINPGHRRMEMQDIWNTTFGRFIDYCLNKVGLDRTDVWMTNLYKYKTENNRPLTIEEKRAGMIDLLSEIEDVNPKVIVLLGKTVADEFGMKMNVQTVSINKKYMYYAIHHPSFVRRNWDKHKESYINQFRDIKKLYER